LNVVCDNGKFLCPDGSCNINKADCPNQMGCFPDAPYKCASGQCVNLNTTKCEIASCPESSPIKCLDGLCVTSISSCPSFLDLQLNQQCLKDPNGNIVPCADGRCVASSDQCRPVSKCLGDQVRCKDGSCKPMISLCPLNTLKCPESKPYMCDIGACATTSAECPTINGCPFSTPVKCEKSGSCAQTNDQCLEIYKNTTLPNGCSLFTPIKCDSGLCVSTLSQCPVNNACPSDKPVKCLDNTCAADAQTCLSKSMICASNQV